MVCPNCGAVCDPGVSFCYRCGSRLPAAENAAPFPSAGPSTAAAPGYPAPNGGIPLQYQPLGPWAYFGYSLLYSIPLIGLIFLIVNSLDNSNIHRRNHARSYWCILVILVILAVILFLGPVRF